MNKTELVAKMSEKSNLTKKDAELALKSMMESVVEALENKEKVTLIDFGTFEPRERAERKGRNPQTKEEMIIPACTVPAFKPAKKFKEKIKNAYFFK